ncbi:MAG: hypothetical protein KKH12_15880 [Gammaproteobacteria bacterium]|nr:hypothetical protein [Gammaproteobacteria bacterium]
MNPRKSTADGGFAQRDVKTIANEHALAHFLKVRLRKDKIEFLADSEKEYLKTPLAASGGKIHSELADRIYLRDAARYTPMESWIIRAFITASGATRERFAQATGIEVGRLHRVCSDTNAASCTAPEWMAIRTVARYMARGQVGQHISAVVGIGGHGPYGGQVVSLNELRGKESSIAAFLRIALKDVDALELTPQRADAIELADDARGERLGCSIYKRHFASAMTCADEDAFVSPHPVFIRALLRAGGITHKDLAEYAGMPRWRVTRLSSLSAARVPRARFGEWAALRELAQMAVRGEVITSGYGVRSSVDPATTERVAPSGPRRKTNAEIAQDVVEARAIVKAKRAARAARAADLSAVPKSTRQRGPREPWFVLPPSMTLGGMEDELALTAFLKVARFKARPWMLHADDIREGGRLGSLHPRTPSETLRGRGIYLERMSRTMTSRDRQDFVACDPFCVRALLKAYELHPVDVAVITEGGLLPEDVAEIVTGRRALVWREFRLIRIACSVAHFGDHPEGSFWEMREARRDVYIEYNEREAERGLSVSEHDLRIDGDVINQGELPQACGEFYQGSYEFDAEAALARHAEQTED